jgi:hypothetical protein
VAPEQVVLNGIDARTGDYLVEPFGLGDVAEAVRANPIDEATARRLAQADARLRQPHLDLPYGMDPGDPLAAGWGLVVPDEEAGELEAALRPLVKHRSRLAGSGLVRTLRHQAGEDGVAWLNRHGVALQTQQPDKVPYYLLVVGEPSRIPFSFEYDLATDYVVGRLCLRETDAYRRYAARVVAFEEGSEAPPAPRAVAFATRHGGDAATVLSCEHLVRPLLREGPLACGALQLDTMLDNMATKANLTGALAHPPALCFTATHGIGFKEPSGEEQRDRQGDLVCQDWRRQGPVEPDEAVGAADLAGPLALDGTIVVALACFSAGTPEYEDFPAKGTDGARRLAEGPFVSRASQAMIADAGALAVVGHVERAWSCSYVAKGLGPQRRTYENLFAALLDGRPVGFAMTDFRKVFAARSTQLSTMLRNMQMPFGSGASYPERDLVSMWLERNDARNFSLLGDPAVRVQRAAA